MVKCADYDNEDSFCRLCRANKIGIFRDCYTPDEEAEAEHEAFLKNKLYKYFIDYIKTDIEGNDAITDDCIINADTPAEALQELKNQMIYKERLINIEYMGRVTDDDLIELSYEEVKEALQKTI